MKSSERDLLLEAATQKLRDEADPKKKHYLEVSMEGLRRDWEGLPFLALCCEIGISPK